MGRHSDQVAHLAVAVGRQLAYDRDELDLIEQAACLHDVGKLSISEGILDKPGPLDDRQWAEMRMHTVLGAQIIRRAPGMGPVAKLVLHSHERFDGAGYPDGLAGEDIPLGSRIIFACDAFDAMVSRRCYSEPMAQGAALAELRRCAGSQFDPLVVEILCGQFEGSLRNGFGISGHLLAM